MTHINESLTAKGFTPAGSVPQVFGRTRTLDGIVIHHWGVPGQSHDGVVNFFVNGPGSTSAHFVVSAGRIHCLVNPADAAWHSGNAVGNATTIGIECRPEATDGDYETVGELVRFLRGQYGNLPLSPHRNWQATACPGVWDLNRIDAIAGGAASQGGSITPAGDLANTSEPIQEDDMAVTPSFEPNVRASLQGINDTLAKLPPLDRDLRAAFNTVTAFQRDVRADLEAKGHQITALSAAVSTLAGLVGSEHGLDIEQIKQAVSEAIADGLTITVEAGK